MGDKAKLNRQVNDILRQTYEDAGVMRCEICGGVFGLSWHHRRKRRHYKNLDELTAWNQTLLLCAEHHHLCEVGTKTQTAQEYSDLLFSKLRGDDQLA